MINQAGYKILNITVVDLFTGETIYSVLNGNIITNKLTKIYAANYTDKNWFKGYSRTENVLLFNNYKKLLRKIISSKNISTNNIQFRIKKVDYDDRWIRVKLDRNATICSYPSELDIK